MTTMHGPTTGRRRLRSALRRARENAGLTQEQVAEAMDWSQSKLIRIEAGTVSISTNDVKALLAYYRMTDPEEVDHLVELARVSRRRPWWAQYRDVIPSNFGSFLGLESEASGLQVLQTLGIPGLLQTRDYARAVVEAVSAPFDRMDLEVVNTTVEIRMHRQREVLDRPNPPTIEVVLDEASLHRHTGGAACLKNQLLHLVALGSVPHITIQVLPFTLTDYSAVAPFIVLDFAEPDVEAVYLENALISPYGPQGTQDIIDHPAAVKPYQQMFRRLRSMSLSPPESLAHIARLAGELC